MKKLLLLILLVGCSKPAVIQTPIVEPKITLSWNKPEWTEFLVSQVYLSFDSLSKANDIERVCSNFKTMTKQEKVLVISEILVAVMKFESGWKATSQFVETSMGIDPVTKKQVVSEGLLQLSYQDIRGYPFLKFDYEKDKLLPIEKRSITDPFINMEGGIKILAVQIEKRGGYFIERNYWSVLKRKTDQIISLVKKNVEECK